MSIAVAIIRQTANYAPLRKSGSCLSVVGVVAVKQHLLYVRLKIGYNWNISLNLLLDY